MITEFDKEVARLLHKGWSKRDISMSSGVKRNKIGESIQRLTKAKIIKHKMTGDGGKHDKFYTVDIKKL